MGLLDRGAAWLARQALGCAGRSILYRRGDSAVQVVALVGQTPFRLVDEYGTSIRVVGRDYLIRAADLILDGLAVTPAAGDGIEDGAAVWVVAGPGGGEPEWRYSDPGGVILRVHVKRVE